MNPEENNPLANPGVPNFGISGNSMNLPGSDLTTNDNLSMASDSLTAAGLAAAPSVSGPIDFNQAGPSAEINALVADDEPLIPAAPVPGSIGSVTSVPAAEPLANPFAPLPEAPVSGAMPAPEVQPQPAPYNPFAQAPTAAPAPAPVPTPAPEPASPAMTPIKDGVNPAFQPAPTAPKTKSSRSMSPLTAILAIACALLLISTIVFAALFFNAKNSPKIVYVPTVSEGESNTQISFLSCSRNETMNWLVNDTYEVPAVRTYTFNYGGDELSALTDEYMITFENEGDSAAARDIFDATVIASQLVPSNVEYSTNGSVLDVTIQPEAEPLTNDVALTYVYGATEDVPTTSMSDIQNFLEINGFVCTVE